MTRFTQEQLNKLGLKDNGKGEFSKPKVTLAKITDLEFDSGKAKKKEKKKFEPIEIRSITLKLFGEPMPKQSVRSTKSGHHYQPQATVDREKEYKKQISEQLPDGFKMFEHEVHLKKFHCIFQPLKGFHKIKGRMDAIRNGEIFYKNTKPDLIDNLKKLVFDSLSGIVNKDDSIIVTENDTAKYYGIGGCIIITLEGY